MTSRRPRRSTAAPVNYNAAQVFAELMEEEGGGEHHPPRQGSSSSGSDSGEAPLMQPAAQPFPSSSAPPPPPAQSDAASAKKRGKRKAPDPPAESDSDGSNFDPSEIHTNGQDEEEYEEDGMSDSLAPSQDDGGPGRDVCGSDLDSVLEFPNLHAPLRTQHHVRNRPGKRPPRNKTLNVVPGVTSGLALSGRRTTRNKTGGDTFWALLRASASDKSTSHTPFNRKNQPWEEQVGFEGAERDFLAFATPAGHPIHTRSAHPREPASTLAEVGLTTYNAKQHSHGRLKLNNALRRLPFAPDTLLCQDLGWYKGKFTTPQRWGGWYHDNPQNQHNPGPALSYADAEKYFPWEAHSKDQAAGNDDESMQAEIAEGQIVADDADDTDKPKPRHKSTVPVWVGPGMPNDQPKAEEEEQEGEDPDGSAKQRQHFFLMERFSAIRLDQALPGKPGHLLNAGAPVWCLDWCPLPDLLHPAEKEYLAVGTMTDQPAVGAFAQSTFSSNSALGLRGFLQIWSLDVSRPQEVQRHVDSDYPDPPTMLFEGGLCVDAGEPWALKWCPRGGHVEQPAATSLGILAGVFTDGRLHFFDVPVPKAKYIHASPVLTLSVPDTSIVSFDWSSHERVVAGCENGHIVVWDVGQALRGEGSGLSCLRPTYYIPAHEGSVRSVAVVRNPPVLDPQVGRDVDSEPHLIGSSGTDGSQVFVDLRDQKTASMAWHSRSVGYCNTFDTFVGCYVMADGDDTVSAVQLRPKSLGLTRKITQHQGGVHSLAASSFHPFVASASADGTCQVSNSIRRIASRHNLPYTTILFRLDYNRRTGDYRMVDHLPPELQSNTYGLGDDDEGKPKRAKAKGGGGSGEEPQQPAAAWLPEVGVQSLSWGKSMHRPCLLASGTHSGLVRVDWVEAPPVPDRSHIDVVLESHVWGYKDEE